VGDKVARRHGNKGIIPKKLPKQKNEKKLI
jgi:DNA-directed RNA polymerase beta subunit